MPRKESKFKSITVEENTYDKIERFAREKGLSHAAFLKYLADQYEDIATMPLLRMGLTPIEVIWPREAWERGEPFKGIFTDPGIQFYKSISWIRTVEYVRDAGRPQWPDELKNRIASKEGPPLKFQKMLLISKDALDEVEVWEWAFKWVLIKSEYPDKVEVFAIEDKHVNEWKNKKWTSEYLKDFVELHDMGIYGNKAVGFLEITKKSEPGRYIWVLNPKRGIEDEKEDIGDTYKFFKTIWNAANAMFDALASNSREHIDIKKKLGEKLAPTK